MWAKGLTGRQRSAAQKKIDGYWKDAKAAAGEWFAFDWQSDARWKWEQYFAWRLGFMPIGMSFLKRGSINEFLVPCERPEEFDAGYQPQTHHER